MNFRNIFKRKLKSYLLDKSFRVVEAFKWGGKTYYMFDDSLQIPTGRGMAATTIYRELTMRCDEDYLRKHVRATEVILSGGKGTINLNDLSLINNNLKERLNLAPFPDHIYKLASVVFFDETESPYTYDWKYNKQKITEWKKADGMLDFFLTTPLRDLIPYLKSLEGSAGVYFQVSEEVNQMHLNDLQTVLSSQQ